MWWRKICYIKLHMALMVGLSSPSKQFLKDDQQKKYPGKSDAYVVQPIYP